MVGKKTIKRFFTGVALSVLAAITCAIVGTGSAWAADFKGLMISPASNRIELKNGEVKTGQMTVQNTTDGNMKVEMSVASYSISGDNYNSPIYDSPSKYSVMKDWIKLDQSEFVLAPNQSQIVNYTITTPANPPAGMQYATIMAANEPEKTQISGITATSRVGLVLSARMADGKTIDKSNIQNEKIDSYQQTSPLKASFSIKNEGNVGTDVTYSMTIKNALNGSEVYKSEQQSNSVFPESTRSYYLSWDKVGIGFYNVELNIGMNGRNHTTRKIVCTIPIWIILLTIIGILGLIAYAILNHRMAQQAKGGSKTTAKKSSKKQTNAMLNDK